MRPCCSCDRAGGERGLHARARKTLDSCLKAQLIMEAKARGLNYQGTVNNIKAPNTEPRPARRP